MLKSGNNNPELALKRVFYGKKFCLNVRNLFIIGFFFVQNSCPQIIKIQPWSPRWEKQRSINTAHPQGDDKSIKSLSREYSGDHLHPQGQSTMKIFLKYFQPFSAEPEEFSAPLGSWAGKCCWHSSLPGNKMTTNPHKNINICIF